MDPKIVTYPAFTAVGMKIRTRNMNQEIPALWEKFGPLMEQVPGAGSKGYGICDNYDPATGEFDYMAGIEVNPGAPVPDGMEKWEVPAGTFAVFPCTLAEIKKTMEDAYMQWLPASGYTAPPGPMFELYDEKFDVAPEKINQSILYVYVRVARG